MKLLASDSLVASSTEEFASHRFCESSAATTNLSVSNKSPEMKVLLSRLLFKLAIVSVGGSLESVMFEMASLMALLTSSLVHLLLNHRY